MASRSDIVAGGAAVEIKAVDFTKQVFDGVMNNLSSIGRKAMAFGAGMVASAAAAATALTALTTASAASAAAVNDASQRTGVGVETLQELRYAAEHSATSFDAIVKGFQNLALSMNTEKGREELEKLGLSADAIAEMAPEDRLSAIADAIAALGDESAQAAAANALFGKAGFELLPFLQQGSEAINGLRGEARDMGQVLGADAITALADFDDTVVSVTGAIRGLGQTIAASLAPYLQAIGDYVAGVIGRFNEWLAANSALGGVLLGTIAAVAAIGAAVFGFGAAITGVVTVISSVVAGFGMLATVVGVLASPIGLVVAGITAFVAIAAALAAGIAFLAIPFVDWQAVIAATGEAIEWLQGVAAAAFAAINVAGGDSLRALVDAFSNGSLEKAAEVAFMGIQIAALNAMEYLLATVRSTLKAVDDAFREVAKNTALGGFLGTELGAEAAGAGTGFNVLESVTKAKREALEQQVKDEAAAQAEIRRLREEQQANDAMAAEWAAMWNSSAVGKAAPTASAIGQEAQRSIDRFQATGGTSAAGAAGFLGGQTAFKVLEDEAKKQTEHLANIRRQTRDGLGAQIA